MLVRLYPYAPRQGFVLQSYTLATEGVRFVGSRGWYEVSEDLAEVLRKVPQQSRNPEGPRAFAIAKDAEEANKVDARIAEILRRARGEDDRVGTASAPVRAAKTGVTKPRPGARPRATVALDEDAAASSDEGDEGEDRKPKMRTRKG